MDKIMKLITFGALSGYRTYIIGGLMVLNGLRPFLLGDGPVDFQMIMEGFAFMTVRKGIAGA